MNQLTSQIASQLSNHSGLQGLNMGNNTQMNQGGHVVLHVSNLNEEVNVFCLDNKNTPFLITAALNSY